MSRDLTAAFTTAITAGTVRPILLMEGQFDGGTLRFWTGYGDLTWDGQTWTGSGDLLKVDPAEETQNVEAPGAAFSLTGIKSSLISTALSDDFQGRPARIWFGQLDDSGSVISDPVLIFSGKMDEMPITEDPENPEIHLTAENDLVILNKSRERRYTHEDQQIDYSGDKFFEFVPSLQDLEITWGKS
jgi:hypothetical protein